MNNLSDGEYQFGLQNGDRIRTGRKYKNEVRRLFDTSVGLAKGAIRHQSINLTMSIARLIVGEKPKNAYQVPIQKRHFEVGTNAAKGVTAKIRNVSV